jgi:hypothetical protein
VSFNHARHALNIGFMSSSHHWQVEQLSVSIICSMILNGVPNFGVAVLSWTSLRAASARARSHNAAKGDEYA